MRHRDRETETESHERRRKRDRDGDTARRGGRETDRHKDGAVAMKFLGNTVGGAEVARLLA
eukprot:9425152-Lingulodinium_polyedra.AAC.1